MQAQVLLGERMLEQLFPDLKVSKQTLIAIGVGLRHSYPVTDSRQWLPAVKDLPRLKVVE